MLGKEGLKKRLGRDRGDDWKDFRGPQRGDRLAVKKTLGF